MRQFSKSKINFEEQPFHYCIADSLYSSSINITELEHLSLKNHKSKSKPSSQEQSGSINSQLHSSVFNENTMIGEKNYSLAVSYFNNQSYILSNEDVHFQINKNNILEVDSGTYDPILLLGPALILNLALNKVFCLHASSFKINSTLFVLMAKSGTGKSTIARYMDTKDNGIRVTDDILPLKWQERKLVPLPLFPQLKIQHNKQFTGTLEFNKIKLLFTQKAKGQTKLVPIEAIESLKRIVSHTVASKLFSDSELSKHLDFCFNACHAVESFSVDYSHTTNSLAELYRLLNEIS